MPLITTWQKLTHLHPSGSKGQISEYSFLVWFVQRFIHTRNSQLFSETCDLCSKTFGPCLLCLQEPVWKCCNSTQRQVHRQRHRCHFLFLCSSQTTLACQQCHIKHWGSHHSCSSRLMDGKMDGLTDDYIGSADKISVILCTREMRRRAEGRRRE